MASQDVTDGAHVVDSDEHAIALAAIDAAQRLLTAARALLVRRPTPADAGEWLTLAAAHDRTGIKPSRGADASRALKEWLRAREVETTRAGRSLLVRRASLDAALESGATKAAPRMTASTDAESAAAAALARAGWMSRGGR